MRRTVRVAAVAAAVIVGAGSAVVTRAIAQQNQNFDAVQMDVQRVSGNVYMVVGDGGNIGRASSASAIPPRPSTQKPERHP